jgi:hypothetical protein
MKRANIGVVLNSTFILVSFFPLLGQATHGDILYVGASEIGGSSSPTIYKIDVAARQIVRSKQYGWEKGAMTGMCATRGRIIASMYDRGGRHKVFVIQPQDLRLEFSIPARTGENYLNAPYWDPVERRLGFKGENHTTYVLDVDSGSLTEPLDSGDQSFAYVVGIDLARGHYFQLRSKGQAYTIDMRSASDNSLVRSTEISIGERSVVDKAAVMQGGMEAILGIWRYETTQANATDNPDSSEIIKLDLVSGSVLKRLPLCNWQSRLVAVATSHDKLVYQEALSEDEFVLRVVGTSTFEPVCAMSIDRNQGVGSILEGAFVEEGRVLILLADARETGNPGLVYIVDTDEGRVERINLEAGPPIGMVIMPD